MKKSIAVTLAAILAASLITGCGGSQTKPFATSAASTASSQEDHDTGKSTETETSNQEDKTNATGQDESSPDESLSENPGEESAPVRVGSLKGPTSMGLVFLMQMEEEGKSENSYEFTMVTAADELLPKVISGDVDIALVPANVASVLYNRTEGHVSVIDINTLGVLYAVSADTSIQSMADLKGKTVYITGKGTTPDYVFRYLLDANGLSDSDVTLEFKSEPTEVAALLAENPNAIGVLPQPFVTAACAQNESLAMVLDLTREWDALQAGEEKSRLVTGVTLVRNEFLETRPDVVSTFLKDHEKSASYTVEQADRASELIAKAGIIEKVPVAKKALPYCNITCITGQEMKDALKGYLQVLFDQDAKSVGGELPGDDFYYSE